MSNRLVNAQYLRRVCLEIIAIQNEMEQKDLEDQILSVSECGECKIDSGHVHDCQ